MDLIGAVYDNDIKKLEELINMGYNLDFIDKTSGCSALIFASIKNNVQIVKLLIKAGVNLDLKRKQNGYTALMDASYRNNLEIVDLLIKAGANLNSISKYGDTALMLASEKCNLEVAKLLINAGANVNAADKYGNTAINMAIENCPEIAKLLINVGANMDLDYCLDLACKVDNLEIVKLLIKLGAIPNTYGIEYLCKHKMYKELYDNYINHGIKIPKKCGKLNKILEIHELKKLSGARSKTIKDLYEILSEDQKLDIENHPKFKSTFEAIRQNDIMEKIAHFLFSRKKSKRRKSKRSRKRQFNRR